MSAQGENGRHAASLLDELVEAEHAVAFFIDPIRATLEAGNERARAFFRLAKGMPLPLSLDSAMPAMVSLRHVLATTHPAPIEALGFWIAGRMTVLAATVALIEARDGRTLLLVRAAENVLEDNDPATQPRCATGCPTEARTLYLSALQSKATGGASDGYLEISNMTAMPRSDTETLREIAKRIREGYPARQRSHPKRHETEAFKTSSAPSNLTREPSEMHDREDPKRLAKIAHELKTPLSAIVSAAEIMRDERLGAMGNTRYLDYAHDISKSARHALEVIDEMMSREADEKRKAAPLALDDIVEEVVAAMMPVAYSAGVALKGHAEKGRLHVLANGTAVRQIIFNLINNALKFTPKGGEIHVMTGFLDDGSVYLVVRDTGVGMDEATITRAFFGEGDAGTPRVGGGYGYGLPIVRQLAQTMGAALEADSAPGKGTAILLSFPHYSAA